jgi:hypothetical protein
MGRMDGGLVGWNCGILCPVMAVRNVVMHCDAWGLQQGRSEECLEPDERDCQITFSSGSLQEKWPTILGHIGCTLARK